MAGHLPPKRLPVPAPSTRKSKSGPKPPDGALPSPNDLVDLIGGAARALTRSEIARAFRLKGEVRADLRRLLADMETAGDIVRTQGRRYRLPTDLPPVTVIEVFGLSDDGEPLARPIKWEASGRPPSIIVQPHLRISPRTGQRLLARIKKDADGQYTATPMHIVGDDEHRASGQLVGLLRRDGKTATFTSADRALRGMFRVVPGDIEEAADNSLVAVERVTGAGKNMAVRVVRVLALPGDTHIFSRIAAALADLPDEFSEAALAQANSAEALTTASGKRKDLRAWPFVTIDGADARDFDDAVCAFQLTDGSEELDQADGIFGQTVRQQLTEKSQAGAQSKSLGWHIAVAIADVSHYVRAGTPLDDEARQRGNSVYFPDRVVPMLPERLSNDLCSLRPNEDRPCLVAHMLVNPGGEIVGHRFARALIRSAARLTYDQVETAKPDRGADDGQSHSGDAAWQSLLPNLYGAFDCMIAARRRRGTLDLDLPEYKVLLADDGSVTDIVQTQRHDSHKLIEEFMIAANVAAAQTLERRGAPCMFRIHDVPDKDRIDDLVKLAREMKMQQPGGKKGSAQWLSAIITATRDPAERHLISQLILRSQAQAQYAPDNIGHFGLGLRSYAHFTSPIRRYADLLVHRALIAAQDLGEGGLDAEAAANFAELGGHLVVTERRAMAAERDTVDRYTAAFLSNRVGETFLGVISGVGKAGLFVSIDSMGADGLVPMSRLGRDRYRPTPSGHALAGARGSVAYQIGQRVEVVLEQVEPLTGSMIMALPNAGSRNGSHHGPDRRSNSSRPPKKTRKRRRR